MTSVQRRCAPFSAIVLPAALVASLVGPARPPAHAAEISAASTTVGVTAARRTFAVSGNATVVGQLELFFPVLDHVAFGGAGGTLSASDHATLVHSVWRANNAAFNGNAAIPGMLLPNAAGGPTYKLGGSISIDFIGALDALTSAANGGTADVVNISAGWPGLNPRDVAQGTTPLDRLPTSILDHFAANNPNTVFVVAAGNLGNKQAVRPAVPAVNNHVTPLGDTYNGIAVGATNATFNAVSAFSLGGPTENNLPRHKPEIVAPGTSLRLLTSRDVDGDNLANDDRMVNGTSFAAPIVTAGVSLMQDWAKAHPPAAGANTRLDHKVIKSILMTTASKNTIVVGPAGANLLTYGINNAGSDTHDRAGAGQLNVNSALNLSTRAQIAPGGDAHYGWDLNTVGNASPAMRTYGVGTLVANDTIIATMTYDRRVARAGTATATTTDDMFTDNEAGWQHLSLTVREAFGGNAALDTSAVRFDTAPHLVVPARNPGKHAVVVANPQNSRTELFAVSFRVNPRPGAARPGVAPPPAAPAPPAAPLRVGEDLATGLTTAASFISPSGSAADFDELPVEPDPDLEASESLPIPRPDRFVPQALKPASWSHGANDLFSLTTPGPGARVFFSVDDATLGMAPQESPRIENAVNTFASLGSGTTNTYYTSVLQVSSPGGPALAADGVTGNFLDFDEPELFSYLPGDIPDAGLEAAFTGIVSMENFGVNRTNPIGVDRTLGGIAAAGAFSFFSLAADSPLISMFSLGDVIVRDLMGGLSLYATASQLGISSNTVIGGLVVDDDGMLAGGFPTFTTSDRVLFSVEGAAEADLRLSQGAGSSLFAPAAQLGLLASDKIVGLDVLDYANVPEPTSAMLAVACLAALKSRRRFGFRGARS